MQKRLYFIILTIGLLLLITTNCFGTASIAPDGRYCKFDSNGDPLVSGFLHTYEPGTTTDKASWTTSDQSTPNANPVELDASGCADVWLEGSYRLQLRASNDSTVLEDTDDIEGVSNLSVFWAESGNPAVAPTAAGVSVSIGNANNVVGSTTDDAGIFMGSSNNIRVDSDDTVITGGTNNEAAASTLSSFIGGGRSNTLDATKDSAIAGGSGHNIDTIDSQNSFIGGGLDGTITTGLSAGIIAASSATVNGDYSVVIGGRVNTVVAAATESMVGGGHGTSKFPVELVMGGADWAQITVSAGVVAQWSNVLIKGITPNATPTAIFAGDAEVSLIVPAETLWGFKMLVTGVQFAGGAGSAGDAGIYTFVGGIRRDNAGNTALVGSVTKVVVAEDTGAWDVNVTANDSLESLVVTVTGAASNEILWEAKVEILETGYGSQ